MDVDGAGAAKRRRERPLRAKRHTVAMELAAASHHSRDAGPNVTSTPQGDRRRQAQGRVLAS